MIQISRVIALILVTISCNHAPTSDRINQGAIIVDSSDELRFIMRDNKTLVLPITAQEIKDSELFGTWKDSLIWKESEGNWHGLEYIDRHLTYEFYPSMKFALTESYTYAKLDTHFQGEFWTSTDTLSSILILATNAIGDTSFAQGDTMNATKFRIRTYSKNRMMIQRFDFSSNKLDDEIIDLVKK